MLPRSLSFLKSAASPGVREAKGPDMSFDLLDSEAIDLIPNIPGVYIIVATKKGISFQYPNGKSPVMYIGMSKNLRQRIKNHATITNAVACRLDEYDRMHLQCHQRYHYFRAFGAKVYLFTRRGTQQPKEQESFYLGKFYERYLSLPVSNGARSFSCK